MATGSLAERLFAVLQLLCTHTDLEHSLDAASLTALLREERGIEADPRSVRRALRELIDAGMPISDERGYRYTGVLTRGEAEYLACAVRCGAGLSEAQRGALLGKLSRLTAAPLIEDTRAAGRLPVNEQLPDTLAVLSRAMQLGRQVTFCYADRDTRGCLQPRRGHMGATKLYHADPYAVVQRNGYPYLLATVNGHEELSHYRVDRIQDIRLRRVPIAAHSAPIDVERYLCEHPYMYAGPVYEYRLSIPDTALNDAYDSFGLRIGVQRGAQGRLILTVRSDERSMELWCERYDGVAL